MPDDENNEENAENGEEEQQQEEEAGGGDASGLDDGAKAVIAKERQARKDADKARKKAEADLAALRAEHGTEQEKALAAAKAEAKAEAVKEIAPRLLAAEVKSLAGDRITKKAREALLDGLDATKFLTEDGDVDTDKVKTLVEGIAGKPGTPDLGQGRRGGAAKTSAQERADARLEKHGLKPKT